MADIKNFMTVSEVAKKLGIMRQSVHKAIQAGKLGHVKIDDIVLVHKKSVEQYKVNTKRQEIGKRHKG